MTILETVLLISVLSASAAVTSGSPAARYGKWRRRVCRTGVFGSTFQPEGIDVHYYPTRWAQPLIGTLFVVDVLSWPLGGLYAHTLGRPVVQTVLWYGLIGVWCLIGVGLIIALFAPHVIASLGMFYQ